VTAADIKGFADVTRDHHPLHPASLSAASEITPIADDVSALIA
jgi:acyl dehydratase